MKPIFKPMEYKTKNLNADYLQSSFWWDIIFKQGVRTNKVGKPLKTMRGYSKFNGEAEAMDSRKCFCSKITMLDRHNYLRDAELVQIHKRMDYICKVSDPIFVELLPDRFIIPPEYFSEFPTECLDFLKNLYSAKKKGIHHSKLGLIPPSINSKDQLLAKTGWNSWEELYKYAEKLKSQNFAQGAIAGYLHREMERLQIKGRV
jgi:hypothetical protein